MFPVTVPVRVNPPALAEIEQVTDPEVELLVTGGSGLPLTDRA
jgi:hypothetical protein